MGQVIMAGSASEDILRDVRLTLAGARSLGEPYQTDAEGFLADIAARAETLEEELTKKRRELEVLRSQQATTNHRCNDLVGRIKDDLWNLIGRTAKDPVFAMIFPGGKDRYTSKVPSNKPTALELLATVLQTHPHPLIPQERVAAAVEELRAAAEEMAAVNTQLGPMRVQVRLVSAQVMANAKQGRLQLARLKRYWASQGMSSPDIHRLIPDRPRSSDRRGEVDAEIEEVEEVDDDPTEAPAGEPVEVEALEIVTAKVIDEPDDDDEPPLPA